MVALHVSAAQAAATADAEVHLHCVMRRGPGRSPQDLAQVHADLDGLRRVQVFRHRSAWALRSVLGGMLAAGDVVHLHGVWDLPLLFAAAVSRRHGASYVATPHGMLDPWCLRQRRWKKRLALAIAVRRMLNRAAFIQALSKEEARLMGPLGLAARVVVIPNGVQLLRLPGGRTPGTEVAASGYSAESPYFLFLARLHHKKGVDVLLQAYRRLATRDGAVWPLIVAGPDDGGAEQVRREVDAWDVPGRVILPGPVYGQQKVALLKGAGAVVLPSRQEAFSLTILEALAAAKPVVISDQCHFPEAAACGAGLEVAVDVSAVEQAMAAVQSWSQTERDVAGAAGRALVEREFTWPRVAGRLLDEYRAVAGSASGNTKV